MSKEPSIDLADPVLARLRDIRTTRARLMAELGDLTVDQGAWSPQGEWSLAGVTEHLVLAERGGFDLIWKAAEAYRAGAPLWTGESENRGRSIEGVIKLTWAPQEKAPPSAEPKGIGSLSAWIAHLSSCDSLLGHLPKHLNGLPLEQVIYPHFLSGPLDALQRLDFIRFHMEHHLPQIRRLKKAQGL